MPGGTTSSAAVQRHVVALEQAELVTRQRSVRGQIVPGNAAALRRAGQLLECYQALWLHRDAQTISILDGEGHHS